MFMTPGKSLAPQVLLVEVKEIKDGQRDIENYRPTSFVILYYKVYTTILKGYLCYKLFFAVK